MLNYSKTQDYFCYDGILNGDETGIDCGSQACGPCLTLEIEEISRDLFPQIRLKIKPLANDTLLSDLTLQELVIKENDSIQVKNRILTPPEEVVSSGSGSGDSTFLTSKLDVVFIVDNSGSMSALQNEIQNNLDEFRFPEHIFIAQARDLSLLSEKYDILEVQPVDMFPNTFHIENVVNLQLKSNS